MSRSRNLLALKIAQIIEEYNEREISEAVEMLHKYGGSSALLDFLLGKPAPKTKPQVDVSQGGRHSDDSLSRSVLNLKDRESEKYELLATLDRLVRQGQVLNSSDSLRRFGERVSKSFHPRKSRRETISAIMALLATRSIPEIQEVIQHAASIATGSDSDEYQRLAQFIIRGKSSE